MRDGFWFGVGREMASLALVFVGILVIVLAGALAVVLPRLWWRIRGTPCGERPLRSAWRDYPPCPLVKGHAGYHAGEWRLGREGRLVRERWHEMPSGSASYLDVQGEPPLGRS